MTVTERELLGTRWLYYRSDSRGAARRLQLCEFGQIGADRNPNEASWAIRDGSLCFFNRDGAPTVEFSERFPHGNGSLLKGRSVPQPTLTFVLEPASGSPAEPEVTLQSLDLFARFESLGGGTVSPAGVAYGCEFGLIQRRAGFESIGLLRWASITPEGLISGLHERFAGLEDAGHLQMRTDGSRSWHASHRRYSIYLAHTGLPYEAYSADDARHKLLSHLSFLRRKLLESLSEGTKIFVYRTKGGAMPCGQLKRLASVVHSYGGSPLLYVRLAAQIGQTPIVERCSEALMVGHITHFGVVNDPAGHNDEGWADICRAALVARTPSIKSSLAFVRPA